MSIAREIEKMNNATRIGLFQPVWVALGVLFMLGINFSPIIGMALGLLINKYFPQLNEGASDLFKSLCALGMFSTLTWVILDVIIDKWWISTLVWIAGFSLVLYFH